MFDRDELGNYHISSITFVCFIIISFIFLWYTANSSEPSICVEQTQGYDLMTNFDRWIPYEPERENVWDAGVEVPLNRDGYPRIIPFKQGPDFYVVRTIIPLDPDAVPGKYTLSYKGSGIIKVGYDAREIEFYEEGEYAIDVNPTGKGIYLSILASDILNVIHEIKIITPIQKQLVECEVTNSSALENTEPEYIIVSESDLINKTQNENSNQDNYNLKDKLLTGLITVFAILAVIYILK